MGGIAVNLRHLPPVHSPLDLGAVASGVRAMLRNGSGAAHSLGGAIRSRWAPDGFALTDSGTSALALALRVAARTTGAPAALPAYGCYDLATAVDAAGVAFTLYDVDPASLQPDLDSVRRTVAAGAGSVVAVHLFGVPVDLAALREAAGAGAILVEDAAQGAGIQHLGRPAGAHGDLGILSFGRGKGMTGGGGGALLLNGAHLGDGFAQVVEGLAAGGRGSPGQVLALLAQWGLARPWLYALPASLPWLRLGDTIYREPHQAAQISAFSAAVVGRTLRLGHREALTRRRNVSRITAALGGRAGVTPVGRVPPGWEPGWLRMPVLAGRVVRDRLGDLRRHGVYPGYPLPLSRLGGFGARDVAGGRALPGAERLASELVTLSVHSRVTSGDIERVVAALKGGEG
ncbi:MAG TPA: DegT/DnrJ/EryC1/StrS family aminotransferase [Gemmatimonadales bacterium]|nr:DegT/DnrJ/EryC1/StrS family aminotransferase [Gemmatimonadales bacterium]